MQPAKKFPGRSADLRKAQTSIAAAVRERVPASVMVDWHIMRCSGKAPLFQPAEDGEIGVVEESGGFTPTLEQRTASLNWLADRGHGLPAQMIHLEAELRAQMASLNVNAQAGQLGAGSLAALARIFRGGSLTGKPTPANAAPLELVEKNDPTEGEGGASPANAIAG